MIRGLQFLPCSRLFRNGPELSKVSTLKVHEGISSLLGYRHYSDKTHKTSTVSEKKFIEKQKEEMKAKHKNQPEWVKREQALTKRYGTWNPTRKLSRQQIQDIRNLKEQVPHLRTIDFANYFRINPEAIRRILKSKWVPNDNEVERIQKRSEERKLESQERKQGLRQEMNLKNERLRRSQSIHIDKITPPKPTFNYDSRNSRSPYKKKNGKGDQRDSRPRKHNRPFVQSVADVID
ncbi:hypothetical protein HYPBUDRAFT_112388 [Hyphopichia burtonii NRRL Y-1933]|uniref:Required for respiratory growth protein 9, mitochondrial n=1 Tax=Hyphopichia burtonii NRRL Y-1933 TaxID=984485 RepID=A0A1E4RFU2_9ASCO|nr:hypothetical protein HYPBUDRAFT_112388 [Hyphopichia burtonii NRRL Y-1933]ODV66130.1 hypothetical protein HYPBUDRAFT_112388 [Hyphopichia burtonii NRRL Y-1933]